jgi:hypothetical protein
MPEFESPRKCSHCDEPAIAGSLTCNEHKVRRPYVAPRLVLFGTIGEITSGAPSANPPTDTFHSTS